MFWRRRLRNSTLIWRAKPLPPLGSWALLPIFARRSPRCPCARTTGKTMLPSFKKRLSVGGNEMQRVHRRAALSALALSLCLATAAPGWADTWPSRPVTLIVPFAAGTTSDVIARALAKELGEKLGAPFVIE